MGCFHPKTLGLGMNKRLTPITFMGSDVPWGGSIIHFYYSPAEQARCASFLADAVAQNQAAILACTFEGYQVVAEELRRMGILVADRRITRIELAANLTNTIYAVSSAAQQAATHGKPVRVLVDFDSVVPQGNIFDAEAAISATLQDLDAICLTQYDGRAFPAPITIEQFRTHALAIVGNVFHKENSSYTRPEQYLRYRAGR